MATPVIAFSEAGISGQNEALVDVDPLLSIIKSDWRDFLGQRLSPAETDDIRKQVAHWGCAFRHPPGMSARQGIAAAKTRKKAKKGG